MQPILSRASAAQPWSLQLLIRPSSNQSLESRPAEDLLTKGSRRSALSAWFREQRNRLASQHSLALRSPARSAPEVARNVARSYAHFAAQRTLCLQPRPAPRQRLHNAASAARKTNSVSPKHNRALLQSLR